jgi:Flp pilus assembly protein TadG
MTLRAALRQLRTQRRGAAAVEFAMIGTVLMLSVFGTIDLGMVLWTQTALQSVSAMTVRCAAISSPLCADIPTYAVNQANNWTMSGLITTDNVHVTSVGTCNGATGTFQKVSITASFWANVLPPPFDGQSVTGSACFPKP